MEENRVSLIIQAKSRISIKQLVKLILLTRVADLKMVEVGTYH